MRRVFFTGAGGVGKTSVLTSVEKKLSEHGIRYVTFLSVSRDFFKAQGITSEQAGLERSEADRLAFQASLFDFYSQKLEHATNLAQANGAQVFLSDRSPHDHLAYLIYNTPNLLTFDNLHSLRLKAMRIFNRTDTGFDPCNVFHFPCVAPWMTADVLRDGMRHAPPGKNFMIDALIEVLSKDLNQQEHRRESIRSDTTVEERAVFVYNTIMESLN